MHHTYIAAPAESQAIKPPARRSAGHVFGHEDIRWRDHQLRLLTGRLLATVVLDNRYAGMYRVRLPDGRVTDIVNLSRAKDAAIALALANLNRATDRVAA